MNHHIETISLFICISGGIQGGVLILALNKLLKDKNVDRKWLLIFIGSVSITLLGRILYLYPHQVDSRIPVLSDMILFVYGPLYLLFLKSVFRDTSVSKGEKNWHLHFIPALLHLLATLPLFSSSHEAYVESMQSGEMLVYYNIIMVLSFFHNLIYWWLGLKELGSIRKQFDGVNISFSANFVLYLRNWYLIVISSFGLMVIFYQIDFHLAGIGYQLTWILASWITYGLGYYVLTRPETFGDLLVNIKTRRKIDEKERREYKKLANQIVILLEEKRIFLDPEISLLSMAKKLGTNNVMLSKTINQYFKIGFYDLINKYRVEEFIKLAGDSSNNHFTYYALALQAGFNSKTSFNKYFKKITGLTPKEYFRKLSVA